MRRGHANRVRGSWGNPATSLEPNYVIQRQFIEHLTVTVANQLPHVWLLHERQSQESSGRETLQSPPGRYRRQQYRKQDLQLSVRS